MQIEYQNCRRGNGNSKECRQAWIGCRILCRTSRQDLGQEDRNDGWFTSSCARLLQEYQNWGEPSQIVLVNVGEPRRLQLWRRLHESVWSPKYVKW